MHNPEGDGNAFFVCDFCRNHWADDRSMVEGHKGALICSQCLSVAFAAVVHQGSGKELAKTFCTLCLEHRDQPQWASPTHPDAHACLRCLKQAASVLTADPDFGWQRPVAPAGAISAIGPDEDDEIDTENV